MSNEQVEYVYTDGQIGIKTFVTCAVILILSFSTILYSIGEMLFPYVRALAYSLLGTVYHVSPLYVLLYFFIIQKVYTDKFKLGIMIFTFLAWTCTLIQILSETIKGLLDWNITGGHIGILITQLFEQIGKRTDIDFENLLVGFLFLVFLYLLTYFKGLYDGTV